jgi:DNA-directed RNA polymerase subunit RPC12/RpoP
MIHRDVPAMTRKRICLLRCFDCSADFEKELESGEAITSAARQAICPKCGYQPQLTRPGDIWSAVNVHHIIGMK